MSLLDMLNQATGGQLTDEFDQVAQGSSQETMQSGIAAAMRSDQTPAFGDMMGQMFGQSSSAQQAGMLNQILASVGPAVLSGLAGGVLGRMLQPGQKEITPEQASQLSPDQVKEIATHAEAQHPRIVDDAARFYAQHAGLIKTLGGAALAIALAHMKQNATRR